MFFRRIPRPAGTLTGRPARLRIETLPAALRKAGDRFQAGPDQLKPVPLRMRRDTRLAILEGRWQNDTGREEYLLRFRNIDTPLHEHARGRATGYGPND